MNCKFVVFKDRKIQKLIEDFKVSEWKDLDNEVIDLMQKWDFNTGGSSKKASSATASSPGYISLNIASPYEKTFSFFTNRLYIEALLRKGKYEDFFATCLDLCLTYTNFPSGEIFIRHLELDGLKTFAKYVQDQIEFSIVKLEQVKIDIISSSGSKIEELIVSDMKLIREPLCLVIRVTAIFMKVSEVKSKASIKAVIGTFLSVLSALAPKLASNLLKCFEILEKGQKSEGFLK